MIKTRFRFILCCSLLAILLFLMSGCGESEMEDSFSWKISRSDSNNSIYVLGILPFLEDDGYLVEERIYNAFWSSPNFIIQTDDTSMSEEEVERLFLKYGIYEEGTLAENISSELYEKLEIEFKNLGEDIQEFSNGRPWAVADYLFSLAVEDLNQKGNNISFDYIESTFLERAKGNDNKTIFELISLGDELKGSYSFDDDLSEEILIDALLSIENLKEDSKRMLEYWKEVDVEGLEKIIFENLAKDPSLMPLYEKVYFEKNKVFVEDISQIFEDGEDAFLVMSAGYLLGENGMLKLFEDKGFNVEMY